MKHRALYEMLHIGHLGHVFRRLCDAEFAKCSVTRGMPFMLAYLQDHDGCIQRDLAKRWGLDPATVTSSLSTMEEAGLVERRPVPGDRRALQVFLTPLGRERAQFVDKVHKQYDDISFRGFSAEEKASFKAMLDRIEQNLQGADEKEENKENG